MARELVILDGVSGEHDGKTYCAAEQDRNKELEKNGIAIITQGFITGVPEWNTCRMPNETRYRVVYCLQKQKRQNLIR